MLLPGCKPSGSEWWVHLRRKGGIHMPKIEKSIVVAAPPDKVWEFVIDPRKWHSWYEGLSEAKSIQGDGGVGTVIEHSITVYNIPMPLKTTVVTFEPGARWKSEFTGPMTKGAQEWTYEATNGGTEVGLIVETELSGPAKLAERMVINAFDKMTDQSLANLKERVESS